MSALVWLQIVGGIILVSLLYLIGTQIIYVYVQPAIKPSILAVNSTAFNTTSAINTMNLIDNVWAYIPLILIFGLLAYGFVAAQRREPDEVYY